MVTDKKMDELIKKFDELLSSLNLLIKIAITIVDEQVEGNEERETYLDGTPKRLGNDG